MKPGRLSQIACGLGIVASLAATGGLTAACQSESIDPGKQAIRVFYPHPKSRIQAQSTFLIGSCPPGASLTVNSRPVRVNQAGYFAHVVPLSPGKNSFKLESDRGDRLAVLLERTGPPPPITGTPPVVDRESVEPSEDLGVTFGDIIELSIRGTPGSSVEVALGRRRIPLTSASHKAAAFCQADLKVDYGLSRPENRGNPAEIYCGSYRVRKEDSWKNVRPVFTLTSNSHSVTYQSPARISTVSQTMAAITTCDDTVVRLGPGLARTTPWPAGVRLTIDGWKGDWMRCRLSDHLHAWVKRDQVELYEDRALPTPVSTACTVNIEAGRHEVRVMIPLRERLPFQIEQSLSPNRLAITIYGATADTDWITQPGSPLSVLPVDYITWTQPTDSQYRLTVHLKGERQWGYAAAYEGATLVVSIRQPPRLAESAPLLAGIKICVDPGHGGDEPGAIGPSGVRESQVNLAIAARLAEKLSAEGAQVILTRSADRSVSLAQRVQMAWQGDAQMLVSIHNNALPDGQDPWEMHGTSTYWYHPQSLELARILKSKLIDQLGFVDFGTRYQNLALTRPTSMPAVLVEVGFMIHPDEYATLIKPETQEKAAQALFEGIVSYLRQSQ